MLAATGLQEALTLAGRYCAGRVIIAGRCRCGNACSRNAQARRRQWDWPLFSWVDESRFEVIGRQQPRWSADVVHPYAVSRE